MKLFIQHTIIINILYIFYAISSDQLNFWTDIQIMWVLEKYNIVPYNIILFWT